jgi:alpha-beta hydrolase superfamily lysophospholipase
LRSHVKFAVGAGVSAGVFLLNLICFLHAYALTHFTEGGIRPPKPEEMGLWQKARVLATGVRIPRPTNASTPQILGLSCDVHYLESTAGLRLEAWHISHAQAKGCIAMFHGYAASKATLLQEAHALYELGYSTFLVDFRGSGGSEGSTTTIGAKEAEDVRSSIDYVRRHWPSQPLVLYGQSMGAAAILRAVSTGAVRPEALLLESPFDRLLTTVENRFAAMKLPTFPCARLIVFWGGVQHGFNAFQHNPFDYARFVDCPTLLLHGEKDPRVNGAQAKAIYANLAGTKQFEVFGGVGHESCMSACPLQWKQCVGAFLSRHVRQ